MEKTLSSFRLGDLTPLGRKPWLNGFLMLVKLMVKSEKFVESYSGFFSRLDPWLAGELIKSIKGIPELSPRIQGYVEGCARKVQAPHGRTILNMISRHSDVHRNQGALLTTQSVFRISWHGHSVKELQEFSSLTMRTLNAIPLQDWPSERMFGEWLFQQLRNVKKLERTIDAFKRSDPRSHQRNFSFLWDGLQQFLVEEREDVNARAIEQSLRNSSKKQEKPKPITRKPCKSCAIYSCSPGS